MGRKPLGATASTVLSSSLEFIPRSFKPKGGGGTTVKIVLKEKHKKGKGWRGQVLCTLPELTSPGLGTPGKLFQQQVSTTDYHLPLLHNQPHPAISALVAQTLGPQPFVWMNPPTTGLGEGRFLGCFGDLGTWEGRWSAGRPHVVLPGPPDAEGQGGPPCTYLQCGGSVLGPLLSPWRGEQKGKTGRQPHGDKGEKTGPFSPWGLSNHCASRRALSNPWR